MMTTIAPISVMMPMAYLRAGPERQKPSHCTEVFKRPILVQASDYQASSAVNSPISQR
jgi:hypothetical protein